MLEYVDLPGDGGDYWYWYDGLGRRIMVFTGTIVVDQEGNFESFTPVTNLTKKFVYLGGSVIRQLDNNDNVEKEYIRGLDLGGGIGGIIYQEKGSDYYYYHYNHKGDVVALTDGDENLAAYYEYDAWGNTMTEAEASGVDNPYRYSTKEWDEKSGLYYFGARYYSPEIGRWTQRDPLGIADGLNPYLYAADEPASNIDIWGLKVPVSYYDTGKFRITLEPNPFREGRRQKFTIAEIEFEPSDITKSCCDEITFVQVARTRFRKSLMPFSMAPRGWHEDRLKRGTVSPWTFSLKTGIAYLYDAPGEAWAFVKQSFETCAKCVSGKWAGEILGCMRWGHTMRHGEVVKTRPASGKYYPGFPYYYEVVFGRRR